ncbi:MAG: hypothetical protein KH828_10220 [Clostridiales bacterium]|nr:hypothetical protein [Clostridiales bacterium]
MKYQTEVFVKEIRKDRLFQEYRMKESSWEACKLCPNYGKVWSCPPDIPEPMCYLEPFQKVFLTAVKVVYSDEVRKECKSPEQAENVRLESYEQVKKAILCRLLEKEKEYPGSKVLGAGRCTLCGYCSREEGKPCRHPEQRRYSITSFGFDFSKMLGDIFDIPLRWSGESLPEYDVAVAALFVP